MLYGFNNLRSSLRGASWSGLVVSFIAILMLPLLVGAHVDSAYADTVRVVLTAYNTEGSQGTVGFDSSCGKSEAAIEVEAGTELVVYASTEGDSWINGWRSSSAFGWISDGGESLIIRPLYDCEIGVYFSPNAVPSERYCYICFAGISNGASTPLPAMAVKKGEAIILSDCPDSVPDGLVFAGWKINGALYQPGDSYEVGFDVVAMPEWESNGASSTYGISFTQDGPCDIYFDGMTGKEPYQVLPGTLVCLYVSRGDPSIGVKSVESEDVSLRGFLREKGYMGCFWFVMPDHDCQLAVSTEPASYYVTFDAGGGGGRQDTLSFHYEDKLVVPECAFIAPSGKLFDCWEMDYSDIHYSNILVYPGDSKDIFCDVALTALWKEAPSCDHSALIAVAGVDPICDSPGTEAYWKCTECGKLFSDAEGTHEIAAPVEIPAGHDWGEWEVTKEPTATEEGEKTRVCKRDSSHTETMAIPPKGEVEEPYEIAMIEDLIWSPEDAEGMTITVVRADDGVSTLAHFLGVSVDGVSVPPLGYTAEEGSLILTLKPAYLESLDEGSHRLDIRFDDGTVSAAFAIQEHADPAPAPAKSGLPIWAWILIGAVGAGVAGGVVLIFANRRGHAGGSQAHSRRTLTTRRR